MRQRFLTQLMALDVQSGSRVVVAVSGGVDSVALLDLLAGGRPEHGLELVVAHVDHGITPESGTAAEQVERLAESYGLRCVTSHLQLGADAGETIAREHRYRSLDEIRKREGAVCVMTAHHADDQAETVLLRVLHGSGPAGLAGMAARRGTVLRPLLPFTREELASYVHQRGLTAWEDPANRDERHLRSWIRRRLLPAIRDRLPTVNQALRELASQAAEDRAAWDRVIDTLPGLMWSWEATGGSVAAAPFAGYDSALAGGVLRAVARRVDCQLSREQARRAVELIRAAESGTRLDIGNDWILEIVFGRIHFCRSARVEPECLRGWPLEGDAGDGEFGRWRLYWRYESAPTVQERDGLTAWFVPQPLEARPWMPGDKVHPLGGKGRRLVVRCLQDARVPRREREGWPMVTDAAGEIVWVPGVCRSNRLVPRPGVEALRVDAQVV